MELGAAVLVLVRAGEDLWVIQELIFCELETNRGNGEMRPVNSLILAQIDSEFEKVELKFDPFLYEAVWLVLE